MSNYQGNSANNTTRGNTRRGGYMPYEWQSGSYRQQYEGSRGAIAQYSTPTPRGRGFQRGGSRDSRNVQRVTNMREQKGLAVMRSTSEALDAKIGVGMKEVTEALNKIEANKTLVAITTIITTRGISFTAAQIYYHAAVKRNAVFASIYSFYRVSLAVLEVRIMEGRSMLTSPYQSDIPIDNPRSDPALTQVVSTLNAVPELVRKCVNAAGPIEEGQEYFVPAFPAKRYDGRRRLVVLPGEVRFSNLRDVVLLLSDRQYPVDLRRNFYARNPIPGATWNNAPDNPILANPDVIMPAAYDLDALQRDVNEMNRMMAWMQQKLPKFVTTERLDFKRRGEKSILISNAEGELRYPDLPAGMQLNDYYNTLQLQGNITDFWSTRGLQKVDQLDGCMILEGEIPSVQNFVFPTYILRHSGIAGWKYDVSYNGVQQILYG